VYLSVIHNRLKYYITNVQILQGFFFGISHKILLLLGVKFVQNHYYVRKRLTNAYDLVYN